MILLTYPLRLLLIVAGYLALYTLGTSVAWAFRSQRPGRVGQAIEFVRLWGTRLWLGDVVRMSYYLLAPYLVLQWGWASPRDLGLADLDWMRGLGLSVAIGVGGLFLLLPLWWQYARLAETQPMMRQARWLDQLWGWALALREAILLESWWALCRSPMLLLVGPYLGVYLGLAAVSAAALLSTRTRHELGTAGFREEIVLTASIASVTATLYVFVHNLWLCVPMHFCLRMVVLQLVRWGAARRAEH